MLCIEAPLSAFQPRPNTCGITKRRCRTRGLLWWPVGGKMQQGLQQPLLRPHPAPLFQCPRACRIYIHMHAHACACTYTHAHACASTCTLHVCAYILHACTHAWKHPHMYMHCICKYQCHIPADTAEARTMLRLLGMPASFMADALWLPSSRCA